jgi:putative spermidine/putrescine transport system ATP-binding protein
MSLSSNRADVAPGSNAVRARVRDIEYMGSYRTVMLDLGTVQVEGRARIPASGEAFSIGDEVFAWWKPAAQRIVAA